MTTEQKMRVLAALEKAKIVLGAAAAEAHRADVHRFRTQVYDGLKEAIVIVRENG
jgi:hypothetical protein